MLCGRRSLDATVKGWNQKPEAGGDSALSFVGTLIVLFYIPLAQSLPSWSCGFNPQLVHLVGRFWVLYFSRTAPEFQLWFYLHLCMWVVHRGFAPKSALEDLGLPSEDQVWRWHSCLDCRGPGTTRYLGEPMVRAAGNMVLLGYFSSLWHLCPSGDRVWRWCSCLDHKDSENARYRGVLMAIVTGDVMLFGFFLASDSSAPLRIEYRGGTAAWIMGTLETRSV